jgi:hypothetical protein
MASDRRPTAARVLEALGALFAIGTLMLGFLGTLPEHPDVAVGREVFGDIPDAMVLVFYIGVSAFVWLMFHLFAERAVSWQQGDRESRTGRWGERFHRLYEGLTMKTLMRDRRSGVMHSMVYYGFIVLFLGTVTLEIDHILPTNLQFLHGTFYLGYSAVLDLAGLPKSELQTVLTLRALAYVRQWGAVDVPTFGADNEWLNTRTEGEAWANRIESRRACCRWAFCGRRRPQRTMVSATSPWTKTSSSRAW